MAPRKTSRKKLNTETLAELGAERLASLLMELAENDAALKRRLTLEIAGPQQVASEIRKRLGQIARSQSFIEWNRTRPLIRDLDTQREVIVGKLAPHDPQEAMELLWRFLALAPSLYERCDDSGGGVGDQFWLARKDLAEIASGAGLNPEALADRVFETAVCDNDYSQYDNLITALAPAMGEKGLARLKAQVEELARNPVPVPPKEEWEEVGWGSGGPYYAHERAESSRKSSVKSALMEIADAQGDVDAWIIQYDQDTRRVPAIAAGIASRLLAAGRATEALAALDGADMGKGWIPSEYTNTRLAVLEALGKEEEAQALRWREFESGLSKQDLRDYLKRLPDFDDVEAEERAFDLVVSHPHVHGALSFLIDWPALDRAAKLVLERADELDGDHYPTLTKAADALSAKHPLAATLALRAMVEFTLGAARSKRYRYAARHLLECESLEVQIENWGRFEPHDTWLANIREKHKRKLGFWRQVG